LLDRTMTIYDIQMDQELFNFIWEIEDHLLFFLYWLLILILELFDNLQGQEKAILQIWILMSFQTF